MIQSHMTYSSLNLSALSFLVKLTAVKGYRQSKQVPRPVITFSSISSTSRSSSSRKDRRSTNIFQGHSFRVSRDFTTVDLVRFPGPFSASSALPGDDEIESHPIVLAAFTVDSSILNRSPETQLPAVLQAALPENFPTATSARKACRKKRVLVNGEKKGCICSLQAGDRVEWVEATAKAPPKERVPVLFEDDHMAVVLKPPGIKIHGRGRSMARLLPHSIALSPLTEPDFQPMHVHRLDAATGGVLVAAKTKSALISLCKMFEERRVHKRYLALVVGRMDQSGEMTDDIDGKPSLSHYTALKYTRSLKHGWITTVALSPHTGRKHQLRRHLALKGHPILGDPLYGVPGSKSLRLWAMEIKLPHPVSQEEIVVSTESPPKFDEWCAREERRWHKFNSEGIEEESETSDDDNVLP